MRKRIAPVALALLALCALAAFGLQTRFSNAQESYYFLSGYSASGIFLQYWREHGELAQIGYPITNEVQEVSPTDGKTYTVQYFERAVFEYHPENNYPLGVLLSLLGTFRYKEKYRGEAPGQTPNNSPGSVLFEATGKRLGGLFLDYWRNHGGLEQQGYPISDEFQEKAELDGKTYTVQYFERAVFEYHPENTGTHYEVLLSQLGTLRLMSKGAERLVTAPLPGNGHQAHPAGSRQYIVWAEGESSPAGVQDDILDIRGIDLKSGLTFTVTEAPGDQDFPNVDGDTVIWLNEVQQPGCRGDCQYSIRGKKLSTGQEFTILEPDPSVRTPNIAHPELTGSLPVLANSKVAWVEITPTQRLMLKEIDGAAPTVVATPEPPMTLISSPRLSSDYIVWIESEVNTRGESVAFALYARNLDTSQTMLVMQEAIKEPGRYFTFSLSGHNLVWTAQDRLNLIDLNTSVQTVLSTQDQFGYAYINGDTVIYTAYGGVWGMKLSERKPVLLFDQCCLQSPFIAGDWLVYGTLYNTNIGTMRLDQLFANPKTPLPTPPLPVPTQPPALSPTVP